MRLRRHDRPGDDRDRSRGQAMVEFALVAPLLFLLILGTIEAGRFIFFLESLNNATREGARYAIVHGAHSLRPSGPLPNGLENRFDPEGIEVMKRVQGAAMNLATLGELTVHKPVWTNRQLPDVNPSPGDASTGTNDRGDYVTVFVEYTYRPIVAEVVNVDVLPEITINAESTLVINW